METSTKMVTCLAGAAMIGTAAVIWAASGDKKPTHSPAAKKMAHKAAQTAEQMVLGADSVLNSVMRSMD